MESSSESNKKTFPEGHFVGLWMGICIAICSGIGIPLSMATDNHAFIGIGPAIGVSLGLSIGQGLENKYKQQGKIRPLTTAEKQTRKTVTYAGIGLLAVGIITFIVLMWKA